MRQIIFTKEGKDVVLQQENNLFTLIPLSDDCNLEKTKFQNIQEATEYLFIHEYEIKPKIQKSKNSKNQIESYLQERCQSDIFTLHCHHTNCEKYMTKKED